MKNPYYYRPKEMGSAPSVVDVDVCIYGGQSGGVIAAVQLRKLGHSVALVEFGEKLGGLSAGGLGATDVGEPRQTAAIGGLSRRFYQDVAERYGQTDIWNFEPHVAEEVFQHYVEANDIPVYLAHHLASVKMSGRRIAEIEMENGTIFRAKVFIDATYEGDLLAAAGVSFHVGRESNATYGEVYNGIQPGQPFHAFNSFVDPYRIAGDPGSGLCFGVSDEPLGIQGDGDNCIQAYNFRLCLTKKDDNRLAFACPEDYDPERYTLLQRYLKTGVFDVLQLSCKLPNGKFDTNNYGGFSSDNIGRNHGWPEGSYAQRQKIFAEQVSYQMGMLYFLTNDKNVPAKIREEMGRWGLAADEFPATGGWPHQIYIREGRRMVSNYVMTEHNALGRDVVPDSVGLATYGMDSHHCRRLVVAGRAFNEGDIEIQVARPYPISYRSICPAQGECENLLVSWCVSTSHIAFGSIRMEPVGMVLGQSAATAAALAVQHSCSTQEVEMGELQEALRQQGQILDAPW